MVLKETDNLALLNIKNRGGFDIAIKKYTTYHKNWYTYKEGLTIFYCYRAYIFIYCFCLIDEISRQNKKRL